MKLKKKLARGSADALALVLGLIVVFPLLYGLFGAFRTPS